MALFSRHGPKRKKSTSETPSLSSDLYRTNQGEDEKDDTNDEATTPNEPLTSSQNIRLLNEPISDNICTVSKRCKGILPEWLKFSGNYKVWSDLIEEMNRSKLPPLLLWGPTGSGKTRGVKDCATACGLRIFEIEPSVLDSTESLKKWVINIVSSKTLLGPRALLIDIIEGFDESYILVFESILKKMLSFTIPVIFIADTIHNYTFKNLFSLIPTKLRIYRQCPEKCVKFAKLTFAKNIHDNILDSYAATCNGDLRKLRQAIQGNYYFETDESLSLFGSTKNMVLGQLDVDRWTICSEEHSLKRLIWDNYINLSTDLDKLSDFASILGDYTHIDDSMKMSIYSCGLNLKVLYEKTYSTFPKMTLYPNVPRKIFRRIETYEDHVMKSYNLDIPELLNNH